MYNGRIPNFLTAVIHKRKDGSQGSISILVGRGGLDLTSSLEAKFGPQGPAKFTK